MCQSLLIEVFRVSVLTTQVFRGQVQTREVPGLGIQMDGHLEISGRLHLVSRSVRLPACTAFEVAASCICLVCRCCWCIPACKVSWLFLHVVPKMLMERKDALVVSALDRESEDPISFPSSATDTPSTLGGITQFP